MNDPTEIRVATWRPRRCRSPLIATIEASRSKRPAAPMNARSRAQAKKSGGRDCDGVSRTHTFLIGPFEKRNKLSAPSRPKHCIRGQTVNTGSLHVRGMGIGMRVCMLLLSLVVGCADRVPVAPFNRNSGVTVLPEARSNIYSSETRSLGADGNDGSGSTTFATNYGSSTNGVLVDVTVSGQMTREHIHTHDRIGYGPSGYSPCYKSLVIVTSDVGVADSSRWWPVCSPDSMAVTARIAVKGTVRAIRTPGDTNCTGYAGSCYTYSGSQDVSIVPAHGSFWLTIDGHATPGNQLIEDEQWTTYLFRANSDLDSRYWSVTSWTWTTDGQFAATPCPVGYTEC